jgi:hypothetical protein
MRPTGVLAGIVVVVLANAFVLITVAFERRNKPTALVELTERELCLPPRTQDNSALSLVLTWDSTAVREDHKFEDGAGWFDQAKLAELGFDVSRPLNDPEAQAYYQVWPAKEVYVALEFDGTAAQQIAPAERAWRTRLFAIDAARDRAALARRYPDRKRCLLFPGLVRARLEEERDPKSRKPTGRRYLRGVILDIAGGGNLHVPLPLSRELASLVGGPCPRPGGPAPDTPHAPRYAVKLAFGGSGVPRVEAIRRLR